MMKLLLLLIIALIEIPEASASLRFCPQTFEPETKCAEWRNDAIPISVYWKYPSPPTLGKINPYAMCQVPNHGESAEIILTSGCASIYCADDEELNMENNQCEPVCRDDQIKENGACKCPTGKIEIAGTCVDECDAGSEWNPVTGQCESICQDGNPVGWPRYIPDPICGCGSLQHDEGGVCKWDNCGDTVGGHETPIPASPGPAGQYCISGCQYSCPSSGACSAGGLSCDCSGVSCQISLDCGDPTNASAPECAPPEEPPEEENPDDPPQEENPEEPPPNEPNPDDENPDDHTSPPDEGGNDDAGGGGDPGENGGGGGGGGNDGDPGDGGGGSGEDPGGNPGGDPGGDSPPDGGGGDDSPPDGGGGGDEETPPDDTPPEDNPPDDSPPDDGGGDVPPEENPDDPPPNGGGGGGGGGTDPDEDPDTGGGDEGGEDGGGTGPGGGEEDGGGTGSTMNWPELEDVPSYNETADLFMGSIQQNGILAEVQGIGFPSGGGSCPFGTYDIPPIGQVDFSAVCTIWEEVKPTLSTVMYAIWSFIAVLVLLGA